MMLSKTKRTLMWIAMTIFTIIVLCWIFYVAYVDFAVTDASSKAQQYQQAYQQWSGPAASGDTIAQYRLGELHEKGLGVPVNPVEAHVWYDLSARGGLDASNAALARLQATMQPDQIEEAGRLLESYANVLVDGEQPSAIGPSTAIPQPVQPTAVQPTQQSVQSAQTSIITSTVAENGTTEPVVSGNSVSASSQPVVSGRVVADATTEDTARAMEQQGSTTDAGITEAIQRADSVTQGSGTADANDNSIAGSAGSPETTIVTTNSDTITQSTSDTSSETTAQFPTLTVCETQQMLSQIGYPVGTIDGIFGDQTSSAIASYQQATGLEVTGVIDRPLIASLLSLPWDGASIRSICSRLGV